LWLEKEIKSKTNYIYRSRIMSPVNALSPAEDDAKKQQVTKRKSFVKKFICIVFFRRNVCTFRAFYKKGNFKIV